MAALALTGIYIRPGGFCNTANDRHSVRPITTQVLCIRFVASWWDLLPIDFILGFRISSVALGKYNIICSKTSDIDTIDIRNHWTESYWWEVSNNSYKDQASNSRKAIIWTNEDSITLLVNVTLSIEVLIKTHKHNIWITDVSDSPLYL